MRVFVLSAMSLIIQESDGLGEEAVAQSGSKGLNASFPLARWEGVKCLCEGCQLRFSTR